MELLLRWDSLFGLGSELKPSTRFVIDRRFTRELLLVEVFDEILSI